MLEQFVVGTRCARLIGDHERHRPRDGRQCCNEVAVADSALHGVEELSGLVVEAPSVLPGVAIWVIAGSLGKENVENSLVEQVPPAEIALRSGLAELHMQTVSARQNVSNRDVSEARCPEAFRELSEVVDASKVIIACQQRCRALRR